MKEKILGLVVTSSVILGFVAGRFLLPAATPDTLFTKIERCDKAGGEIRYYTDMNLAWIKAGVIESNTFSDGKLHEVRIFHVECYKEAQSLFIEELN